MELMGILILFLHVLAVMYVWLMPDGKYILYGDQRDGIMKIPFPVLKTTINTYPKSFTHFSFLVKTF